MLVETTAHYGQNRRSWTSIKKEVQRLIDEGKAYYCYCTEEELQKEREEQLAEGKTLFTADIAATSLLNR